MAAPRPKNPFDLDKGRKAGPELELKGKIYTSEEQRELLDGYVEIPREFWGLISFGAHVRYVRKDGRFLPGGFVKKNPHIFVPQSSTTGEAQTFIQLQNSFFPKSKGYVDWNLNYDDIGHLYEKNSSVCAALRKEVQGALEKQNENIRKLAEANRALRQRIDGLERRKS